MSMDHDKASYCKNKRCTNLLLTYSEFIDKYCYLCQADMEENWDKEKEDKKTKDN